MMVFGEAQAEPVILARVAGLMPIDSRKCGWQRTVAEIDKTRPMARKLISCSLIWWWWVCSALL